MNILLIVLDTARGDVVNSMISGGELSSLSKLATEGQFYTNARSNGPWTVPSHAALFYGMYPSETGVNGDSPSYETVPLIEELNQRGFKTGGFSSNPWLSYEFNFDKNFDVFRNQFEYYPETTTAEEIISTSDSLKDIVANGISELYNSSTREFLINLTFSAYRYVSRYDSGASWLFKQAVNWLKNDGQRFAFINVTEPHLTYELPHGWLPDGISQQELTDTQQDPVLHNAGISTIPEDDLETLKQVYKSTLCYLDAKLGKLYEQAPNDTVFIITSDHGEHFGEYGRFGHQYSLYDELLHVPLVIHAPWIESNDFDSMVELRSLYRAILNFTDDSYITLPVIDYHIAETISPTPSIESLRAKSDEIKEYTKRYENGARCISDSKRKLIEFADGSVKIVKNDRTEADTEDIKQTLHRELVSECGEITYERRKKIDYSDKIKSRLDDLGYV